MRKMIGRERQARAEDGAVEAPQLGARASDPAPSRLKYRLQRLMLTPLFRLTLRVGLPFCLFFAITAIWLGDEDRQQAIQTAVADLRRQIETRPEFMVKLMAVEGASASVEEDIREIFPFDLPASSFEIDLDYTREMIVGLPAVKDATLRVRRGGTLVVEVNEREPVAVWRNHDGLGLVDRQGYVVADLATRAERADLPVIAGAGADKDVEGALAIITAARPLGKRLLGLVRVGERRWDVVLTEGQRILLPEERPVRALERVIVLDEVQDMLERDVAVVDMRLAGRPTVRMNPDAVEEWWRVMQVSMEANEQ
ncbi:MAG: cell division protein FtsQ/DivIB [Roseovarius sp.]